jgi:hypothetical protein
LSRLSGSATPANELDRDNVPGAFDTSGIPDASDFVVSFPITVSSSNQSPVNADKGKFYNLNCSGGDLTVSLPAASGLDNGWSIKVRHDGTANQILFVCTGSDLAKISGRAGVAAFAATSRGQTYTIVCDQTGFKVEQTAPALFNTTGVISIVDILSTPASSPQAGDRYLVGAAPSGAWSTFAQHDIAEATGQGTWFNITPPANSGWIAWVQDEKRHYSHDSTNGWRLLANGQRALAWSTQVGSISSQATLDFTIPADCDEMEIRLWSVVPQTDATDLYMRFSQSGSFLSGASDYEYSYTSNGSNSGNGAAAQILIVNSLGTSTNERLSMAVRIIKPLGSNSVAAHWIGGLRNSAPAIAQTVGYGALIKNTNAIDGVRFLMSSGNLSSRFYTLHYRRYS